MKNYSSTSLFSVVVLCLVFLSCKSESKRDITLSSAEPVLKLSNMDTTVRPQDDFYRFVNGAWIDRTVIPDNRGSWKAGAKLSEQIQEDLITFLRLAENDKDLDQSSAQAKAVRLFMSYTDSVARNQAGANPLQDYLSKADQLEKITDLDEYMVQMTPYSLGNLFQIDVGPDQKDSNKNVLYLIGPDLGLPSRDFYLRKNERASEIREKYVAYISRMLEMTGVSAGNGATESGRTILEFESALANNTLKEAELRNPKTSYNPMRISDLEQLLPSFNWSGYFNGLGLNEADTIVVTQPGYFQYLETLFNEDKLEPLKAYLKWSVIQDTGSKLSMDIYRAGWGFYAKELRGVTEQTSLEQRAIGELNRLLGEALGQLYIENSFSPEVRQQTIEMIENIVKVYRSRLAALEWMDAITKEKAIEKLDKMKFQVGFPEKWKDYSDLEIMLPKDGGGYFDSYLSIMEWSFRKNLEALNEKVDKSKWRFPPQEIGGWYDWESNAFVVSAAMLQPPFYDLKADAALNYGGIGTVIAHEISHGFDDWGAQYDGDGNLVNWWSDEDRAEFKRLGSAMVDQYSKLEVLPGVYIDGELTLGENISDFGGVNVAFEALRLHLKKHGDPGLIDGYTQEQRFFIAHVSKMRIKFRDEALRTYVRTDTHTPFNYRATQSLKNMDAFYEVFKIQEGDGMYLAPEERIKIW